MSRQFVIIGLGRLGSAMLDTLLSLDHEVLGIDLDENLIQELAGEYPRAHLVAADATDESVLRDLNVAHFDGAAVVIGENMEAGILATANLKELGVPFVVSRALSKLHGRVLQMIEAEVPKEWAGKSLADLHLSRESGLTILAVKPKGKSGTIPSGDTVLNEGDVIVVGGTKEALDRSPLVRPEGR